MRCVNLVSLVMPLEGLLWIAVFVNAPWEPPPIVLPLPALLILSISFCVAVRRAILDVLVRDALMVSMVTQLNPETIARGVHAVEILTLVSTEAVTP